jgi:hypothetical protein
MFLFEYFKDLSLYVLYLRHLNMKVIVKFNKYKVLLIFKEIHNIYFSCMYLLFKLNYLGCIQLLCSNTLPFPFLNN